MSHRKWYRRGRRRRRERWLDLRHFSHRYSRIRWRCRPFYYSSCRKQGLRIFLSFVSGGTNRFNRAGDKPRRSTKARERWRYWQDYTLDFAFCKESNACLLSGITGPRTISSSQRSSRCNAKKPLLEGKSISSLQRLRHGSSSRRSKPRQTASDQTHFDEARGDIWNGILAKQRKCHRWSNGMNARLI